MNNIKEFLARFWQHVVLHDAEILNEAKAYTDEQGFSGSWNDLTNRPFTDMNALITEIKTQIGYPVVSATAPTLTNSNILWIDTSDNGIAKYHNGSTWVAITSIWK